MIAAFVVAVLMVFVAAAESEAIVVGASFAVASAAFVGRSHCTALGAALVQLCSDLTL
mgnify:CR=1 FL=1